MFADKDGSEGRAAELQKAHYKTDWHRYNLKRRVADFPPVSAENFQQRVLAQREQVLWTVTESSTDPPAVPPAVPTTHPPTVN